MPMTPAILDMIARDQAARAVDPTALTEGEKNGKILALQARIDEMESIATFLANLLQAVEKATLDAPLNDRTYRKLVIDLCCRRWIENGGPITRVTLVEPETGAETFMRRSL
jgi:hypothetical protein